MNKSKKNMIDIKKIIKNNPKIDAEELSRNFDALTELQKRGVRIGPNYRLDSPFSSRPSLHNKKTG